LQLVTQAAQRGGNIIAVCGGYNILPMSILLSNDAIAKNGIKDGMSTDEKVQRMKVCASASPRRLGTDDMVARGAARTRQ